MTEHLRYRDFFKTVILRQTVSGRDDVEQLLRDLLGRLQAKLVADQQSNCDRRRGGAGAPHAVARRLSRQR